MFSFKAKDRVYRVRIRARVKVRVRVQIQLYITGGTKEQIFCAVTDGNYLLCLHFRHLLHSRFEEICPWL